MLVAGGTTAATVATTTAAPKPAITLSASAPVVKVGQPVTFTGHTAALKEGSKVTLQTKRGTQVLRAVDGKTASRGLTVKAG